jgi:antitoxin component of RelBE/YafQ-DinJ toxin-antitoxin module
MKTTMTISLEKDLKENFTNFSKSLGTNPTNLLSMMMKNTLNS